MFEWYLMNQWTDIGTSFRQIKEMLEELTSKSRYLAKLKNIMLIWAATWQNQQNECAPSEDSDQPGHPPSLIRVFAVRMKKPWVLSYSLSASEGSDQTGRMPRSIWVFAGHKLIFLVLSCRGSFVPHFSTNCWIVAIFSKTMIGGKDMFSLFKIFSLTMHTMQGDTFPTEWYISNGHFANSHCVCVRQVLIGWKLLFQVGY